MITIVITACSILFSEPISRINPQELKNNTCREFIEKVNPEHTLVGEVDNPIATEMVLTPATCNIYGQLAIAKWKEKNSASKYSYINKWVCDDKFVDKDEI